MTLTLLLDLDDTLLTNNIHTFLPAYLKLLSKHLIDHVSPDQMVKQLLAATQVMIANDTPGLTLEKSFDQAFYPAIGRTKEELRSLLEQFYLNEFPQLQPLTRQRLEAIALVSWARENGHSVVVATNPIFPRMAILHRLRWAGMDPGDANFALITDYERFHFAKPNPAFFTEILAQLGWPEQPAVVVGNSLEDDLLPAAKLGLPVFWVTDQPTVLPEGFHPLSASGKLDEVEDWVEKVNAADLRQNYASPQALLAVMKSTPAAFDTLGKDLTQKQWQKRPAPEEWSLTEIFCHLRDVDTEVNIPRLEKVLSEPVPFLAGMNTDRWAEERNYAQQDGPAALQAFIAARTRLIERLNDISEADWQRVARHAIFGPTNLQELISFTATHDRDHIRQAIAVANALVDKDLSNDKNL